MNTLAEGLVGLDEDRSTSLLFSYRPYPKQWQFHAAGKDNRERLLMKGNRVGGTLCGANEFAMHLTGRYPKWWPGGVFRYPITAWTGSETSTTSREIIQKFLLGTTSISLRHPLMGTGAIPKDHIKDILPRQAGVRDVADQIVVRHFTNGVEDGESRATLKTYDMGRLGWQGVGVQLVWPDEEPKHDPQIYTEALTRTQDSEDGLVMMTFSPLNGMTPVVEALMTGGHGKHLTTMTIYDAVGGVWPDDSPYAGTPWKGHFTHKRAEEIIESYPEHERDTRAFGVPSAGEGKVFPVTEANFRIEPLHIPPHWGQLIGIDFGINHPFAAVLLAHDRDADCVHVVRTYRSKGTTPPVHASAIRAWGDWQPISWPHDGMNREKGTGQQLKDLYQKENLKLLSMSARYKDSTGGAQKLPKGKEPVVLDMLERMTTGRFKVHAGNDGWFDECRGLHRKNGVIQPVRDDLMKATFYAMMMLRYAMPEQLARLRRTPQRRTQPLVRTIG